MGRPATSSSRGYHNYRWFGSCKTMLQFLQFVLSMLAVSMAATTTRTAEGFADFSNVSQIFGGFPDETGIDNEAHGVWDGFRSLLDAHKGQANCSELPMLRQYLQQFGYQTWPQDQSSSSEFDNATETAILLYQKNFGLNMTGMLDSATLAQMMKPRCGREDMVDGISFMGRNGNSSNSRFLHKHGTKHYSFFPNSPKWDGKTVLTYSIASTAPGLTSISRSELSSVFGAAFGEWAAVVPINFTEISDYSNSDIKIAFASGDHGDGKAFDGVLGVLAHAFSPEDGRLHFDAAETWSVDIKNDRSKNAVDLKSVAVHEIGHILGLGHSADDTAVMFPNIGAHEVKLQLTKDDVNGAQALYGVNPNYNPNLKSDSKSQPEQGISTSSAAGAHDSFMGGGGVFFVLVLLLHVLVGFVHR